MSSTSTRLIDDVNVAGMEDMPTPAAVRQHAPLTETAAATVMRGRQVLRDILDHKDPRLFVVLGPCSIHDPVAAHEYATLLKELAAEVADTLVLVMRVYFEKPRTSIGWKGYINDPHMDDSFRIDEGIERARRLLLHFAEMGLPTGSEALDPLSPQYLGDLISCRTAIVRTTGNRYGQLVLRGGGGRPNYDTVSVRLAEASLRKAGLSENIVVDCSHANSLKDPALQPLVFTDCVHQIREGNRSIVGLMLESHLHAGNQPIPTDLSQLRYGVSVTDGCIDWQTTADTIRRAHAELGPLLARRAA